MIPERQQKQKFSEDEDVLIIDLNKFNNEKNWMSPKKEEEQADMKYILGYLNQGENLQNVTIGNMMQLQIYDIKDLLQESENELELSRESFINKITLMVIAYFCYSTEIRFIIQTKEDPLFDTQKGKKEQEYWHTKCLEVACTFLPGECPLLSHINMTHQKHYAPVKDVIDENK